MANFVYHGQFDPPVDKYLHETWPFLAQTNDGIIIEAGAADGLTESSTYFFEKYFNRLVVNIEADPIWFSRLVQNRPKSINLNYALGNKNQEVSFMRVIHPEIGDRLGHGSVQHKKKHLNYLRQIKCEFVPVKINMVTYFEIISKLKITKVNLMVLDVEGFEIKVLKGFRNIDESILPKIICIEVGWSSMFLIRLLLKSFGYSYHSKLEVNAFFTHKSLTRV
jgi:FkbM family methyltransferase